jgi:hypothetical protein
LYINRNIETYIGLFGYIINATISNINLENVNILGNAEVGGLVGYNNGGTILNSSVSGNVTEIVDYQKAGCLVGENTLGTIDKSFSNCSLIGHGWGTGGLLGANNNGLINNSYSIGDITGTTWVGGLLGYNTGTIVNSYSTGNVNGGGLLGYPDSGGLLGYADTGSLVENSFWDIETSGKDISAGGIGKTTSEMKNIRTYTQTNFSSGLLYAWDFVGNPLDDINDEDIWNLDSNRTINNGYPFFSTLQSIPQYNISEFPADTTPPIMEIISPTENGIYNLSTWTGVTLNYDDSVTCEYSSDNLTWYSFTSCDNTSNYVPTNGIDQTLYVR